MKTTKIQNLKQGQRAAGIATIITLLLGMTKAGIGFLSGSIALIADALHTFADVIAIAASWFGLKIAQKKADEKFPYGYYKAETLATLFISIIILYAAYELFKASYSKLFIIQPLNIPHTALAVSLASCVIAFFIAKYEKRIGTKIHSQSLIANAQESRLDILTSLVVFVGILFTHLQLPCIESIVGILISALILFVGFKNGGIALLSLMDVNLQPEITKKIGRMIKSIAGVEAYTDLRLRQAGPFMFGEVKIKIRKSVNVSQAHQIADMIENKIKTKIKQIESFTIHVEPYKTEKQKIVIPIQNNKGIKSKIMYHFGRATYFIFIIIDKGKIKSWYVKKNPYKTKSTRAGLTVVHYVIKEKIDVLVTKEMGEIAFHILRDNLVDIFQTKGKIVEEVTKNFINDKLTLLKRPTHPGRAKPLGYL